MVSRKAYCGLGWFFLWKSRIRPAALTIVANQTVWSYGKSNQVAPIVSRRFLEATLWPKITGLLSSRRRKACLKRSFLQSCLKMKIFPHKTQPLFALRTGQLIIELDTHEPLSGEDRRRVSGGESCYALSSKKRSALERAQSLHRLGVVCINENAGFDRKQSVKLNLMRISRPTDLPVIERAQPDSALATGFPMDSLGF